MANEKTQVKFNYYYELISLFQPFSVWALEVLWRCQEHRKVTRSFLYVNRAALGPPDRWKSILFSNISREDSKISPEDPFLCWTVCVVRKFFLVSNLNPKCCSVSPLRPALVSAEMGNSHSPISTVTFYRLEDCYCNLPPFFWNLFCIFGIKKKKTQCL